VEEAHREEEAAPEEVAAEEVGVSPGVEVASLPEAEEVPEEGLLVGADSRRTDTSWTPSWISGVFGSVCMVF
jgi:hypothetical protein